MRTLLVVPTFQYGSTFPTPLAITNFPVGLAYLASSLRAAGHEVFGLNPNNNASYSSAREMLRKELARSIVEFQPELIGLGGICTEYRFLRDTIRFCRTLAPDIPIVLGGGIVTHDCTFAIDDLRPDYCIAGEGEEPLVRLAGMLEAGDKCFESIPNLGYRQNGRSIFTERKFSYPDIDTRPFPDYEPFGIGDMMENLRYAAFYLFRYTRPDPRPMTIITARGCPFNCTFCVHTGGPGYRARSIGNIMQELEQLYDRYHFNILAVVDELFAVKRSRLQEFCEAVIQRRNTLGWDFDWSFQTHASASLELEDIKMAKAAGCYFFSYGLESASPNVLASMKKKTRPSQYVEAIQHAHEAQVGFGGNFIFGDVAETTDSVTETITFMNRHLRDDHVNLGLVLPFPGSKLFDDCIARGIIHDKGEFYAHDVGGIFNMTAMPDPLWWSLMLGIREKNDSLGWVRETIADAWSPETETAFSPVFARSGKTVFRVSARCPHCGTKISTVEALDDIRKDDIRSFLSMALRVYRNDGGTLGTFLRHRVEPFLKRKLRMRGFRRDHAVFRLLDDLGEKGVSARRMFATACTKCHKRFRVKIDTAG